MISLFAVSAFMFPPVIRRCWLDYMTGIQCHPSCKKNVGHVLNVCFLSSRRKKTEGGLADLGSFDKLPLQHR